MTTRSSNLDWTTYVPRRVYDAARRLEAACERCGHPSPIAVAEDRMALRPTLAERVLWHQVWCFLMEDHNVTPDYDIEFIVVDDPDVDCIYSLAPDRMN